jgi:hypothetical protein
MFSTDYKYMVIKNIASLREGDHIAYKVGLIKYQHGIITKISSQSQEISIVYYNGKPNDYPRQAEIGIEEQMAKGHLYRYDYDIGIGEDAVSVVARAVNQINKVPVNACWSTDIEFAVWCKTMAKCSPNDASTLAKARVLGHVYGLVHGMRMLKIGDHVAYNNGKVYYYQHAIVMGIIGNELDVVLLLGNVSNVDNLRIMPETVDVAEYIRKDQLRKYFYDVNEWKDASLVTARAAEQVGTLVSERPFKDPQHFAIWCKSGIFQKHGKAIDA